MALQAKIDELEAKNLTLEAQRDDPRTSEKKQISINNLIATTNQVIAANRNAITSQGKFLPPVSVVFSHSLW